MDKEPLMPNLDFKQKLTLGDIVFFGTLAFGVSALVGGLIVILARVFY